MLSRQLLLLLKARKGLEAYNQFVCRWIKEVNKSNFWLSKVITCLSITCFRFTIYEKLLACWIITEAIGEICCAHCNCMVGLMMQALLDSMLDETNTGSLPIDDTIISSNQRYKFYFSLWKKEDIRWSDQARLLIIWMNSQKGFLST